MGTGGCLRSVKVQFDVTGDPVAYTNEPNAVLTCFTFLEVFNWLDMDVRSKLK